MTEKPLMKCGHAANATKKGEPCCVICFGIVDGADEVAEDPILVDRYAMCSYYKYCGSEMPSNTGLAFFKYTPEEDTDEYYCGCRGWE